MEYIVTTKRRCIQRMIKNKPTTNEAKTTINAVEGINAAHALMVRRPLARR
jgi:hypothetical protein